MKIKKLKDNKSKTVVPKTNTSNARSITPIAASHLTSALPTMPYNISKTLPASLFSYARSRVYLYINCKIFMVMHLFTVRQKFPHQIVSPQNLTPSPQAEYPCLLEITPLTLPLGSRHDRGWGC